MSQKPKRKKKPKAKKALYKDKLWFDVISSKSFNYEILDNGKIITSGIIEGNETSNDTSKLVLGGKRINSGIHKINVIEKNFNLTITKEIEINSDVDFVIYLKENDISLEFIYK